MVLLKKRRSLNKIDLFRKSHVCTRSNFDLLHLRACRIGLSRNGSVEIHENMITINKKKRSAPSKNHHTALFSFVFRFHSLSSIKIICSIIADFSYLLRKGCFWCYSAPESKKKRPYVLGHFLWCML